MDEFIKIIKNDDKTYGIRLMNNTNIDDINIFFELFYNCFGIRNHLNREWFDWYYNQNPLGVCNNYLMFDIEENKLIGAYGFSKIAYTHKNENNIGVLGVNGMIDKYYTQRGLYAQLMKIGLEIEAKNNLAFSFPHANNIGSVKGHFKSNWKLFEDLYFYNKQVSKKIDTKQESNIRPIREENLKDLKINKEKGFGFCKDADFIKWRYINRPHKDYIILGNFISDNEINGYIVLGKYVEQNKNIRCQIVDFRAEDTKVFSLLFRMVDFYAKQLNASTIDLILSNKSDYLDIIKKENYRKSKELYKLLVYPSIEKETISNGLLGDFDAV